MGMERGVGWMVENKHIFDLREWGFPAIPPQTKHLREKRSKMY